MLKEKYSYDAHFVNRNTEAGGRVERINSLPKFMQLVSGFVPLLVDCRGYTYPGSVCSFSGNREL